VIDLASARHYFGAHLAATSRAKEALPVLQQTAKDRERIVKNGPDRLEDQSRLARTPAELAWGYLAPEAREKAVDALIQAVEQQRRALSGGQEVARYRRLLIQHYQQLAAAQRLLGREALAASARTEAEKLLVEEHRKR